jgi:hypothetical protein
MKNSKEIINVVYDLSEMPITYDFSCFLAIADCIRQVNNKKFINLVVLNEGYRKKTVRDHSLNEDDKNWRVENIILQVAKRLESVIGIEYYKNKNLFIRENYKIIYPTGNEKFNLYTHSIINQLYRAKANPVVFDSSQRAKKIISNKYNYKYITCTLRTSDFDAKRNTIFNEIMNFKEYIKREHSDIKLIIIPDHDESYSNIGLHKDADILASTNLDYRIALMQNAFLNFGPSNGPICFSFHCKNVKIFQYDLLKSDHTGKGVEDGWKITNGFPIYENYPWAQNGSRLCWVDYTCANMIKDFENEKNSFF